MARPNGAPATGTIATNGHVASPSLTASTERIQIVNEEKNFTPELANQIEKWGLHDAGFTYNIVSVFGSQSTGKSTLLNRLFGTTFDVMDETRRQQTTKGIWMCRGKDMGVMVMDVEGTDGRERGEDQDFERKSALFSLASSEILIVNLWEHQVGLYQGANMGLLKTVFEVNLGLFGKKAKDGTSGRTLLLFVIRDHIGQTPLANLQATLTADLNRIWESLSKPTELSDLPLSHYFDLAFTTLPHKILSADKFEEEVQNLRKRFADKDAPDYLFKPVYHKRIPADGVAFYMEGIWEQVQTNKDLDLPTQQELLAQFRCDEISAVALSEFNEQAKSQKRPVEAGKVVEGLGGMMKTWRQDALARYDRDASRYHKGVYTRKRTDLLAALDTTLTPLFVGQLKNLHKACLAAFKKEMLDGMRGEEYNFAEVVATAKERWEDELQLLEEEVETVADQCRKDETKKMLNQIEVLGKAETAYLTKAKSFNSTEKENTVARAALRKRAWLALRAKIDEQTADAAFLSKLRNHFEERFRYDEGGVPRVWKPDDDIDGAFKKAKEQTLELVPLYSRIAPEDSTLEFELPSESSDSLTGTDEFDFPATLVVFSETKAVELTSKFRKDADAYYVEAKRSTVSSVAQIPYWMYGVLVVLGWNEAMAVLFNPLYFTFLLLALAASYIIIQLGLVGPLFQVLRALGGELRKQGAARLREQFTEPAMAQVQAVPMRNQSYSEEADEDEARKELRSRQL
ncbi:root hair defective 3 GTP-binding protein-domain-containing protein [Pholiota molesta]|nr:root hair defective 3 GTP-binding protein-domain-containing protein [Pholiota molesta]